LRGSEPTLGILRRKWILSLDATSRVVVQEIDGSGRPSCATHRTRSRDSFGRDATHGRSTKVVSPSVAAYRTGHAGARTRRAPISDCDTRRGMGREIQRTRRDVERAAERVARRRGRRPHPGRALDVGCDEGADAIWLARHGWTVTAIDISDVAVSRAREVGERAGVAVEWVCGDALATPFPARSFDLVSMQYPALPKAAGAAAVRALLDTVRPYGLLLAVHHDLDDDHREHMKSRGVDQADYVGADDLASLLRDDFTVELHAVEPRIDPPPDTPHIADVVLRAPRR
jgi:SAM-dependent methyltransferase